MQKSFRLKLFQTEIPLVLGCSVVTKPYQGDFAMSINLNAYTSSFLEDQHFYPVKDFI